LFDVDPNRTESGIFLSLDPGSRFKILDSQQFSLGQQLSPEAVKASTAGKIFKLFIDDEMINLMVFYTNKYVKIKQTKFVVFSIDQCCGTGTRTVTF
jgi:hypothetical protein